ncbi:iron complex outermembrane receptor protein [Sphingomonas vulcanisoli]|uniref:Iron complex outermembrane receptor protein n=1 Tax=Sphingomonas vulcanisoli TaxID=1658060 RepID=A0ABX0TXW1_9SPHN|nr:TonB-dependent receptor [Sphingomonas vulcanisoli]NIJ08590.1 iron complex outermembrane receptor protein [Sphingomonas vulcanisoli]
MHASATARLVAALLVSVSSFATAHAQETAPPATQAKTQEQAIDQAEQSQLQDITVYARKRPENVQNVPIPVTVITPQELTRQNLVNFTDFQSKLPAFSVYLTNPKQLNLGVRGIGNNGFNTDGIDGSVGIFVDGVYSGRPGMVSTDFNDLAQVELLRGPQGTLFGKNTTAGAVIINSLKPSFTFGGSAEATGGNQGFHQFKGSITGPIIDGKLAARLSGYYSKTDGNYLNLFNGNYQNARQGQGVRAQLLATPTENLSIRLIGTYNHQFFPTTSPVITAIYNPAALQARMTAAGYTLLTSNASDRYVNINSRLDAKTDTRAVSSQIDWDLGAKGAITSITAYEKWKCFTNNDNDYTQLNAIPDYGSCNAEHQFSQELRWATPKDQPIEATFGGFLSRQRLQVDSRIRFGDQYYIWAANPSATAFPNVAGRSWAQGAYATQIAGVGIASQAVFHTNTEAVFGNVTWHPDAARRFAVDGGLRYTWEDKSELYNGAITSNVSGLNQAQLNVLSAAGANAQLGHVDQSIKDRSLSGEASLSYKPIDPVMLYLKYARGYKSKGFNLLPENSSNPDPNVANAVSFGATQAIKGETADNIEGGIKSEWFNHHLLLNLTAFHTKVKNYQANEAVGVGNTALKFLANVGSLTSNGVELEGEAWLAKGLHAKGFVSYDHAYYSSFSNSTCPAESTATSCDLTGRTVAWAPKWTADLTVDYSHEITESVTGYGMIDANYRTKQNYTITLDPLAEQGAYALFNARAGVQLMHGTLDLQLWVKNLANKAYFINLLGLTKSTGIVQGYPGDPRTFGGTVRVTF